MSTNNWDLHIGNGFPTIQSKTNETETIIKKKRSTMHLKTNSKELKVK